jgi:glycosyltransferase involved in cell wall biosynthesis
MKHAISVIVPTTASMRRVPLLWRALRSLQPDRDQTVIPIVVVNGDRYVPAALETLKRRRDIRCLYLDRGNHTDARLAGRQAVQTEFFGMLDDDDEYLPGTMGLRLDPRVSDPSVDVVITNGYRHQNGQDVIQFPGLSDFGRDPLGVLMDHPWLHGGGVTFRARDAPAGQAFLLQSLSMGSLESGAAVRCERLG